ncbi:TonB-dependent receptor [Teredinibacter waterburyi]|uniref:TonB-dependent receptor n=1 Tax=Teredinibacter waterburyi TaxID=1500538 RepID=A0A0D3MF74_9GAMM|nr:TonB-dependent receptor [Teredinibacter waterburyi]AIH07637.1 TonB-dependent receptor [Teredinibacter waterburyi]
MSSLKSQQFKLKPITMAVASAAAIMAGSSNFAVAQDQVEEEVIVRGIRASMAQSMDVKRNAVGVVDSINAEDIGKMPDANLAESLQRITGLSITRINGEGARVSARGIDPSLNMVTLNGRNMPAVTNDGNVGDTASRAFDFANLASEVIGGVDVYKTGKASITTGGLGAVVNIKSIRPLEVGNKATIAGKLVHDTTVDNGIDGQSATPEISGLYSFANDDENFGVSFAGAYQQRDNTRSNVFINQWKPETSVGTDVFSRPGLADPDSPEDEVLNPMVPGLGVTIDNAPAEGQLFNLPSDVRYALEDDTRTRLNGVLTVQFAPTDNLTATADIVYSEYELEADRSQQSTWYNYSAISHIAFDNSAVPAPTIYQETYDGGKDVSFAQQEYTGVTTSSSVGVNVDWAVSDALSLAFDFHSSTAENISDVAETGLNANVVIANYADFSYDMPVLGVTIDDSDPAKGNNNGVLDAGDISGAIGTISHAEQTTDIVQLKIDGSFVFSDSTTLNFGVESREDTNHTLVGDGGATGRITMGNWGGVDPDTFGDDWEGYWTARDFGAGFPDYKDSSRDDEFLHAGWDADLGPIAAKMVDVNTSGVDTDNFNSFPDGEFKWNGIYNINREITEEVTSAYVELNQAFDLGDMPGNVVAGLRYEATDVTSVSSVQLPVNLEWQSDNDWGQELADEATPFSRTGDYSVLLPSLDIDLSPSDDVKIRMSYSKTMGRASYGELRSDVAINDVYSKTANGGNPDLEPMKSTNLDLSVEYYYSNDSYISIGYFGKNVSNYIGSAVISSDWYGLRDARTGPRFEQAQADIVAAGGNPQDEKQQHDQMLINEGLDPAVESTSIYADSTDPLLMWDTNIPVNDEDTKIYGFEFALMHWFGDSGFGTQLNYTAVNADVAIDVTKTGGQFAMVGLSDTANLVAFYDDNGVQFRLAYNWRDQFLDNRTQYNNEPSFTEAYYQVDFSASYDITDQLTVTAEGLNLTGENSRRHGRSVNQLWSLEDLGARYNVGVRYSF